MSDDMPCTLCGCAHQSSTDTHRILAALAIHDVDQAIEAGLLVCARCPHCTDTCTTSLLQAQRERIDALASRDRFRSRGERLKRLAEERAARRLAPATEQASVTAHKALPSAAAAALARAKARAPTKP